MTITTLTSREFNQKASEAKRAANQGLVVITDRGQPAHVLMSYADYQRLAGNRRSIVDVLSMPADAGDDFDPPRACVELKPVEWL